MPQPSPEDLRIDPFLTNVLIAFVQGAERFVAGKVFPDVPTNEKAGVFPQYDRGDWNRLVAQKRGPGAPSAGGGFTTDNSVRFFNDVWAVHKDVDEQTRAAAQNPFNPDRDATRFVSQQLLMRKDVEWAGEFFTTGVWTGSSTGADLVGAADFTKWDAGGSNPITDITDQAVAISEKIGREPNKVVFDFATWNVVRNHPEVQDRLKHTGVTATLEIVAALLGVDEVLVLKAIQTTSVEGAPTTTAFIGGTERALLLWVTDSPSILEPSAGYHTTWTSFAGSQDGMRMKNFEILELGVDRIEGESAFDPILVSSVCGAFFTDTIT